MTVFSEKLNIEVRLFEQVLGQNRLRSVKQTSLANGVLIQKESKQGASSGARYICNMNPNQILASQGSKETKKTTQPAVEIETVCLGLGFTRRTAKFEKCIFRLAREPIASEAVVSST